MVFMLKMISYVLIAASREKLREFPTGVPLTHVSNTEKYQNPRT